MAVSIDIVYKTVLLVINKEQRGYLTPDEFNKIATQVQLEIYLKYFEDLNQLIRVPQTDLDYSDRVSLLDEKMSLFKKSSALNINNLSNSFTLPVDLRQLGTVIFNDIESQRISRNEFYNLNKSKLTKPSNSYPIYLYEEGFIKMYPQTISTINVNYLRFPVDPLWTFTVDPVLGNYIVNSDTSINFELHQSEQTEIIVRILAYAGISIKDPNIAQAAAIKVQQDNMNEKQ